MNITIYYSSKKIILQEANEDRYSPSIINIDSLEKKQILQQFESFINQPQHNIIIFETKNLEKGFEKFKKGFKYIYASGGLIEQNNHYLFIFRNKKWDLPKGKLEMGESPEEGGIRECEEECGITKLIITQPLDPTYHIYEYKGGYALKKTFWYAMQTKHEGKLVPQVEEGIEKVEWFNVEQIRSQVITNSYPAILDVIKYII